jgi:hypothetical protein
MNENIQHIFYDELNNYQNLLKYYFIKIRNFLVFSL